MNTASAPARPTLDQRRARHAWEAVARAKQAKDSGKEFKGQAKKLPVRIMTAGLGHALAFLHAKGYARDLLNALNDWVLDKRRNSSRGGRESRDDALMQAIIRGDSDFLRWATEETLAYLQWVVRFADAEIEAESEG